MLITRMNAEEAVKDLGTGAWRELVDEKLTESIISCFYEVYNTLGSALLEKGYTGALATS
jgi:hypothetical protein